MLKVIYVNPMSYGNLEEYDRNILTLLASRSDLKLWYFASSKISDKSKFYYRNNYTYQVSGGFLSRGVSYTKSQFKLVFWALYRRVDVVHFEWVKLPMLDVIMFAVLRLFGVRVSYKVHNILPHKSTIFSKCLYRILYGLSNHMFVHNKVTASSLKGFSSRISIVPHGLLWGNHIAVPRSKSEGKIVVGHLGALSKYKGTDILLDYIISRSGADVLRNYNFIFAGKVLDVAIPDLADLDNVRVHTGYMSNRDFIQTMTNCDVLLLPYREISDSGIVKTAISYGVPVALSSIDSFKELYLNEGLALSLGSCHLEDLDSFFLNLDRCVLEKMSEKYRKYKRLNNSWIIHEKGLIEGWKKII